MGIKKKIAVVVGMLVVLLFALAACAEGTGVIDTISIDPDTFQESYDISEFDISQVNMLITYAVESEDDTPETEVMPLSKTMIKAEDHGKLAVVGAHTITVMFKQLTFDFVLNLAEGEVGKYKVVFLDEEGGLLDQQTISPGENPNPPQAPSKDKHTFVGWLDTATGATVDISSIFNSITLKPKYKPNFYKVTFLGGLNGETTIKAVEVTYDEKGVGSVAEADRPKTEEIPMVQGHTFTGWLQELNNIKSDTTIRANYTTDYITVSFKYGLNGEKLAEKNHQVGAGISAHVHTEDNARLLGWYTNPTFEGKEVTFPYAVNSEMTFYAKYVSMTIGSKGLEYTPALQGGYAVSGYSGSDKIIVIPAEYNQRLVIEVNANAFKDANNAEFAVSGDNEYFATENGVLLNKDKTVLYAYPSGRTAPNYNIPSTVQKIGAYAFYNASALVYLSWGSQTTLTEIDRFAFSEATSLVNFAVPESVQKIAANAFRMTGENAFETITFADNSALVEIGEEAFAGLSKLVSMNLPSSLTSIAAGIFNGCSQLTEINISEISEYFATENGVLYTKNREILISYPANNLNNPKHEYVIDEATKTIRSHAFEGSNLVGIVFPENLTSLETYAVDSIKLRYAVFTGNSAPETLGSVVFGRNSPLIFIPEGSAEDYLSLTNLGYDLIEGEASNGYYYHEDTGFIYGRSLSNELTIYGLKPTSQNNILENMRSVTVPGSIDGYNVRTIGQHAFYQNTLIESVIVEEGVATISDYAFAYASNLKTVALPISLISLGSGVFSDCGSLVSINAEESIALMSVGDETFVKTPWFENSTEDFLMLGKVLVKYNGTGLSATLPDNVSVIGHSTFENKTNLTSIVLNDNLKRIDSFAFYGCEGIFYIEIPASVEYIGESAFLYCDNLYRVIMKSHSPVALSMDGEIFPTGAKGTRGTYHVADKVFDFEILAMNDASSALYKNHDAWKARYSSYIETAKTGRNVYFISNVSEYFEGVSAIYEPFVPDSQGSSNVFVGWYPNANAGADGSAPLIFPVDILSDSEFYAHWVTPDTGTDGLEYVLINDDKEYAVSGYTGAGQFVIIPNYYKNLPVTKILSGAFSEAKSANNTRVYDFVIPESVLEIEEGALNETNWYKQYLGDFVFVNKILIEYRGESRQVVVPEFIRYVMKGAFRNNDFIQSIQFPSGLVVLPEDVLYGCDNLTEVILPQTLSIIRERAFADCRKLAVINFPGAINEVAPNALDNTAWLNNYSEDLVMINKILYKYKGTQRSLHIPAIIKIGANSFAVDKIEKEAFKDNIYLRNIYMPATVRIIGDSAFEGCISLLSVQFADGSELAYIAARAFSGCIVLSDFSLNPTTRLQSIGAEAFNDCTRLKDLEVPASVTDIGERAYMGSGIRFIYIASGSKIRTIEKQTFMNCTSLITVSVGSGALLTTIGESAFEGARNLKSFDVQTNVPIAVIEARAFSECLSLVNIILPITLKEVGEDAFVNVPHMQNSSDTVVRVGSVLLKYTGTDSEVFISKDIAAISKEAFRGNENIKKIVFEAGSQLFAIGEGAFMDCVNLAEIQFPSSVKEVGKNAFENTLWLNQYDGDYVTINAVLIAYKGTGFQAIVPDTVRTIADGVFANSPHLQNIVITAGVTEIGANVFDGILADSSITMLPATPPKINANNNIVCKIEVEYENILASYRENASWNIYTIEVIKRYTITFDMGQNNPSYPSYANAKLIIGGAEVTSLYIDKLFTEPLPTLNGYTFAGWYFVLNAGYSRGEAGAFENKLQLPYTLTGNVTIYAKWISNTNGTPLGEFFIESLESGSGDGVDESGQYITHFKPADSVVVVPESYADNIIVGIVKSNEVRVDNIADTLYNRVMTQLLAEGLSDVYDVSLSDISVAYGSSIYTLQYLITAFTNGTMNIESGTAVFFASYNQYETTVRLAVTYEAFAGKDTISEILFVASSNIKYIGEGVFENCVNLKRIVLPASIISIGKNAFKGCTSLEEVIFLGGAGNLSINESAFEGCVSLKKITLPANTHFIGNNAFKGCTALEAVTILSVSPPSTNDSILDSNSNASIFVLASVVDQYKSVWSIYAENIYAITEEE